MKITDLTNSYLNHLVKNQDRNAYINSYPALFKHYFDFWTNECRNFVELSPEALEKQRQYILRSIDKTIIKLKCNRIDTSSITTVLFVGADSTSGHAFMDFKQSIAFIPVECYKTQDYADIFCAHEIAHALHYKNSPDFIFNDKNEKETLSRMLICEGIATYISKELLKLSDREALWGDYLTDEESNMWIQRCERSYPELKNLFLTKFHSTEPMNIFYLNDVTDPFQSRGGYWFGLKLIEKICVNEKLNLNDILAMSRFNLEEKILKELKENNLHH